MGRSKYTEEFVRNFLKELGCELLSEYTGVKNNFTYRCSCGEPAESNFDRFKNSGQKGCSKCKGKRANENNKLKLEGVKKYFEDQGCELLETVYENSKTPMKYICVCGEEDYKDWNHFSTGDRCPKCVSKNRAESQRLKFEDVMKFFEEYGYKLLEDEYVGVHETLKCICSCGEPVEKSFSTFKANPKCTCKSINKPNKKKVKSKKVYTREELIELFWRYYSEHGYYSTTVDLKNNEKYPSTSPFVRQFGSYKQFLMDIEVLSGDGWYIHDENVVKELYNTPLEKEILDRLMVKRSWGTVENKARKLGLYKKEVHTEEELIGYIQDFFKLNKRNPTARDFDESSVYPNHGVYRSKFGNWTNALIASGLYVKEIIKLSSEDIREIIEKYQKGDTLKQIAENNEVTESRVLDILHKENVPLKTNRWTPEQIKTLEEVYPYEEWDVILEKLAPFKKEDIRTKASKLKITRECFGYDEEQENFLIDNYEKYPIKQLSEMMDKTEGSIVSKAGKLGLVRVEKWADGEIDILNNFYATSSIDELVLMLPKRNKNTITEKANHLGIKKDKEHMFNKRIESTKKELLDNLIKLGKKLGRTPTSLEVNELLESGATAYYRYFGSYSEACKEAGLEPNVSIFGRSYHYLSRNGDVCLSSKELEITNLLIDNNIEYEKEILYRDIVDDADLPLIRCDWMIADIVVEYFGMSERKDYRERMNMKIKLCEEKNVKLIPLLPEDMKHNYSGLIKKFKEFDIELKLIKQVV